MEHIKVLIQLTPINYLYYEQDTDGSRRSPKVRILYFTLVLFVATSGLLCLQRGEDYNVSKKESNQI